MIEKKIAVCVGTDRAKFVVARLSLMVVDDGRILSEQYHRINIAPGADLTKLRKENEDHLAMADGGVPGAPWPKIPDEEWAEVEAIIGVVHKPAVVEKYAAARAAEVAALEQQRSGV